MAEPAHAGGVPPRVEHLSVAAFAIPTDAPEADGTFAWERTLLVSVRLWSNGVAGLGYTYADTATAELVRATLAPVVLGREAFAIDAAHAAMQRAVRNLGRGGIGAMAISAVDTALWDLKARLLGLSLIDLLGPVRSAVPVYGSGGFTSYDSERLEAQLAGWVARGVARVKMKVGSAPSHDVERVARARTAIGARAELFVDANGAYTPKQALALGERFAEHGVSWYEEPVSSDDLEGLALLVQRCPPSIEVAAGEYGYEARDFERLLRARAVDVLQADATRCGGVTGFLRAAALCDGQGTPLSAHCAPALHAVLGCAALPLRHVEWFYDHVRIESELFEGVAELREGQLVPDRRRVGLGLELRERQAQRYAIATRHEDPS